MKLPLDIELEEAVKTAVKANGQPENVAKRLIAWLHELSGNEISADDQLKHLETVLGAILEPAREVENGD
jgi:hypothetical protein